MLNSGSFQTNIFKLAKHDTLLPNTYFRLNYQGEKGSVAHTNNWYNYFFSYW